MFVQRWVDGGDKETRRVCVTGSKSGSVYLAENGSVNKLRPGGTFICRLSERRISRVCALAIRPCNDENEKQDLAIEEVFAFDSERRAIVSFEVQGKNVKTKMYCDNLPITSVSAAAVLEDTIYAVDSAQSSILVFSCDGQFKCRYGSEGCGPRNLRAPQGIAADPMRRELFIADTGNHRIQVLSAEGEWIRTWGKRGTNPGEFQKPLGVAVSVEEGFVAVCDSLNHRVQAFDSLLLGRVAWLISKNIDQPFEVHFDRDDDILVLDSSGAQWFALPGEGSEEEQDQESEQEVSDLNSTCSSSSSSSSNQSDASSEIEEKFERVAESKHSDKVKHSAAKSDYESDFEDDESEEQTPEETGTMQGRVEEVRSREEDNHYHITPGKTKQISSRVHSRFVRDTLELQEEHLQLQSRVKALELELNRLENVKENQQQNLIDQTCVEVECKPNKSHRLSRDKIVSMHKLSTDASIRSCADPLSLEERILELELLAKDLDISLPKLKTQLQVANDRAASLRSARDAAIQRINGQKGIFQLDSEDVRRKSERYREELLELQSDLKRQEDKHKSDIDLLRKEKSCVTHEMDACDEKLAFVRAQSEIQQAKISQLESVNSSFACELGALCKQLMQAGGANKLLQVVFREHIQASKKKMLDTASALSALREVACISEEKYSSIAKVSQSSLKQYLQAHNASGFDLQLLQQAYLDL